ncbi:hypothetical protein LCGC14_1479840 [marine sediment metagenome]|uniref:SPOR domain-containing protein n=1 Tax=marine sediment metagenome TaxID=412755 RepID=A0A0F9J9U3_9ZZZZ
MRKLFPRLLFFLSFSLFAQDLQELRFDETPTTVSNQTQRRPSYIEPAVSINTTFEEAADTNNIPYRTFSGLENVENGYYIISGVFSKGKNTKKTIKKLKRKGFEEAGYITNPESDLNYVYLTYYPFGLEAVDACISQLEGTYTDQIWILEIENSVTIGGPQMAVVEVNEPEINDDPNQTDHVLENNTEIETLDSPCQRQQRLLKP